MNSPYYVTLKNLMEEIGLSAYYMPADPEEIRVVQTRTGAGGIPRIL